MSRLYKLEQNWGYLPRGTEQFISTEFNPAFREKRIVDVNSEKVTALYGAARKLADKMIFNKFGREEAALRATMSTVFNSIPNDQRGGVVHHVTHFFYGRKMPLDHFIENGGSCSHFSLATIALLQRFREDGYISGEMRIAANRMRRQQGHMWAVYDYPDANRSKIIDSTNNLMFTYNRSEMKENLANPPSFNYIDRQGATKTFNYFDNSGLISDDFVARGIITIGTTGTSMFVFNTLTGGYTPYSYIGGALVLLASLRWAITESIYEKRVTDLKVEKRTVN